MGKQHSTRHLRRHGEALTVRNYEFGAEDEHGDAERVETTNSPYATRGRVESGNDPSDDRNVRGTRLDYDVTFYLPESDPQGNEEPFVANLNGVEGDTPPSTIGRDDYGNVYRVVSVHAQANGVLAARARVKA